MRVAVDTGGTFTDCVALVGGRLRVLKVRSTPHDPGLAVLEGVRRMKLAVSEVRHGTTVGTNALLERKGARVAFVTTAGFEDTIAIGRQARPELYNWFVPLPVCAVPPELRFGVPERVSAEGALLRVPTDEELDQLAVRVRGSGAEAVALSLLFSFLRPENELRVEAALRALGLPVSTSHRILPEFREYERASTVFVNAALTPRMRRYLLDLEDVVKTEHNNASVDVMQSSGGIVGAPLAAEEPVRTVLSGPAGGVIGAWRLAQQSGFDRIVGIDVGGTSTDVFLADAEVGGPRLTSEAVIAGAPVSVPMLDIHTAGAGGGSLARFDSGGLLRVGPESAGADPGPICFGKGAEPTVTDANLLLGRLGPEGFLDGTVSLDPARVRARFEECRGSLVSAEEFAAGILRVVETGMERAIRVISVERGHDPRRFALLAFGGGGPLHACALAEALAMTTVLVPPLPGALSAVGILLADGVRDLSRTVMLSGEALSAAAGAGALETSFGQMEQILLASNTQEDYALERSLDLRYRGQGYELNLPYGTEAAEQFHQLHERRFGFADHTRPLEVVTLRVRLRSPAPAYAPVAEPETPGSGDQALAGERSVRFGGEWLATPLYARDRLRAGDRVPGPALLLEYSSTTVLPPGWSLRTDGFGMLILNRTSGG